MLLESTDPKASVLIKDYLYCKHQNLVTFTILIWLSRELEIKQVMLLDSFQLVRTKLNEFI